MKLKDVLKEVLSIAWEDRLYKLTVKDKVALNNAIEIMLQNSDLVRGTESISLTKGKGVSEDLWCTEINVKEFVSFYMASNWGIDSIDGLECSAWGFTTLRNITDLIANIKTTYKETAGKMPLVFKDMQLIEYSVYRKTELLKEPIMYANAFWNISHYPIIDLEVEFNDNAEVVIPVDAEKIKAEYKPGAVIELLTDMINEKGMPAGLKGKVEVVDDAGSIHISWDNGRTLAVLPGVDGFKIVGD